MIELTLVYAAAPHEVFEQRLSLPEGSTARQAVQASGLPARHPELDWAALAVGVWGRAVPWEAALKEGDRLELCRPLRVDPKVARRERFSKQGARGTGLFAQRRPGGKAGY